MIRRLNIYRLILRLICFLLPLLSFTIAWVAWFSTWENSYWGYHDYDPRAYFELLTLMTVVWAIAAESYGVSTLRDLWRENTGFRAALSASVMTAGVTLAAQFFYWNQRFTISRVFAGVACMALLFQTLIIRAIFRRIVRRHFNGKNPVRIIIVGADRFAVRMAMRLKHSHLTSFNIVGYIRIPGQEPIPAAQPCFNLGNLDEFCVDHPINEIVIAVRPERFSILRHIMDHLERLCFPVRLAIDLGAGIELRDSMLQFGRVRMLDLSTSPAESVPYVLLKRTFDVVFSVIAIVLTLPLMLIIAIAVRLSSPGPIFFVQERVGLNGRLFQMYKFRTMRSANRSESDRQWTTENDPRRTRLGIFLRRYNLDELPQFFNVLRGDMSVVGPRPERPHFARRFHEEVARYSNRHTLRVGITGWAQVNGWRGDTSISKRVEYDRYYLRNWSLGFDLQIIFLTVISPLARRNAY